MKNEAVLRLSALSLALAMSVGSAWSATTTVTGSTPTLLSGTNLTVSDSSNNSSAATKTQASTGTLGQFDSSLGVLTGAAATLTVPTTTTSLGQSGGSGSASVSSTWNLGGNTTTATLNSTSSSSDTIWSNVSLTSSAANLNNYVGSGNIASDSFSTVIGVSKSSNSSSDAVATVNKSLVASQSIVYTYTAHSNASFTSGVDTNSLVYDFGHINSGTGADHGFSIYGLAGGLGLTNFTVSFLSGNNVFAITGAGSVGAGATGSYNAHFNAQSPSVFTNYSGTYRITFTDNVSGLGTMYASNSVKQNYIDITMTANVPEPETYALFLAGLSAIGFIARRRRPQR